MFCFLKQYFGVGTVESARANALVFCAVTTTHVECGETASAEPPEQPAAPHAAAVATPAGGAHRHRGCRRRTSSPCCTPTEPPAAPHGGEREGERQKRWRKQWPRRHPPRRSPDFRRAAPAAAEAEPAAGWGRGGATGEPPGRTTGRPGSTFSLFTCSSSS